MAQAKVEAPVLVVMVVMRLPVVLQLRAIPAEAQVMVMMAVTVTAETTMEVAEAEQMPLVKMGHHPPEAVMVVLVNSLPGLRPMVQLQVM
jgi:hypothetical protein